MTDISSSSSTADEPDLDPSPSSAPFSVIFPNGETTFTLESADCSLEWSPRQWCILLRRRYSLASHEPEPIADIRLIEDKPHFHWRHFGQLEQRNLELLKLIRSVLQLSQIRVTTVDSPDLRPFEFPHASPDKWRELSRDVVPITGVPLEIIAFCRLAGDDAIPAGFSGAEWTLNKSTPNSDSDLTYTLRVPRSDKASRVPDDLVFHIQLLRDAKHSAKGIMNVNWDWPSRRAQMRKDSDVAESARGKAQKQRDSAKQNHDQFEDAIKKMHAPPDDATSKQEKELEDALNQAEAHFSDATRTAEKARQQYISYRNLPPFTVQLVLRNGVVLGEIGVKPPGE